MVWVAGVLGRHVGGGRTRALQHNDQFNPASRRRKIKDGHVKVVDRWEEVKPTPTPPDAKIRVHTGGEIVDPYFTTVYGDDYLLIIVQRSDDDTTA